MLAESMIATRVHYNPLMLLAGDLGGTKTLLGLFERGERRPRQLIAHEYPTQTFDSFTTILDHFERDAGRSLTVDAVAVGVAGPIVDKHARLTNIPWDISVAQIATRLAIDASRIALLNDLEAMAYSVPVLEGGELAQLQRGERNASGNAAVIEAGTGLRAAYPHFLGGRLIPVATETGHADFAARTDREFEFVRLLRAQFGRAEIEQVLSGPGVQNLHRFTHQGIACGATTPADISQSGLSKKCPKCVEALEMFADAYGAEAGNVALRSVATGGVFIGGVIAPKILPALQDGRFMKAFRDKAPMAHLVSAIPVHVIVNPDAGLLGAAVAAQRLV